VQKQCGSRGCISASQGQRVFADLSLREELEERRDLERVHKIVLRLLAVALRVALGEGCGQQRCCDAAVVRRRSPLMASHQVQDLQHSLEDRASPEGAGKLEEGRGSGGVSIRHSQAQHQDYSRDVLKMAQIAPGWLSLMTVTRELPQLSQQPANRPTGQQTYGSK